MIWRNRVGAVDWNLDSRGRNDLRLAGDHSGPNERRWSDYDRGRTSPEAYASY